MIGGEGWDDVHPLGLTCFHLRLVELARLHQLARLLNQKVVNRLNGLFTRGRVADLVSLPQRPGRGGDLVRVILEQAVVQVPAPDLLGDGFSLRVLVIGQGRPGLA
jgi:hypothetical protein